MATVKVVPTPMPTTMPIKNVLAFRTTPGAVTINAAESRVLGVIDVDHFERIRLVADERVGSTCNVWVRLTITEGDEWVAFLDHLMLTPHAQITKTYDVPGTKLTVAVDGVGAANTKGSVDILVYGQY